MGATVVRYCPHCGAAVKGPESAFASPTRCPQCDTRAQFYDYPREHTPTPVKTSKRNPPGWLDWLLWSLLAAAALTASLTLFSLINGWANGTLLSGIACLAVGLASATFVTRVSKKLSRAETDKKKAERALLVSNSKVAAAAEINKGFKKNFDVLVADEKKRLQTDFSSRLNQTKQLQAKVEKRVEESSELVPTITVVGKRLLDESLHRISRELSASNLGDCRMRLKHVIEFCRDQGCKVSTRDEDEMMEQLERDHQAYLLEAKYKNERMLVEAKMQEEQRVIEQIERGIKQAEAERSTIASSLSSMLKDPDNSTDSRIEHLRAKLQEAEARMSEASSVLHDPTAGHVYVLSNIGAFGEGIFLIGFTRMADPLQHIEELSKTSVPFPYDIHMLVPSENAEVLAKKLYLDLHESRLNRFNHSKSFFKTTIKTIWQLIVAHHGNIDFVEEPPAREFKESLEMSEEAFASMTDMHRRPEKYRDPFDSQIRGLTE